MMDGGRTAFPHDEDREGRMAELVTIGETMALLTAPEIGRLRDMEELRLSAAGAESNVAIGVRRLGHSAAWIGRIGDDEFGRMIVEMLRREAVDVSAVRVDADVQTGLMFKERRTSDVVRVTYYREGFAGSRLGPDDLDEVMVATARVLHLTGITPGLSRSAREATHRAIEIAQANDVIVSFDLNYRSAIWPPAQAAAVYRDLIPKMAMVFASEDELTVLDPDAEPLDVAKELAAKGAGEVVVKQGGRGALVVTADGVLSEPALAVHSIDPVGAGDAFVAGYLAAALDDRPIGERLRQGCACGAFAVTVLGDWEGLPSFEDLRLLRYSPGTTLR
jgi:2-dehydro-3-deoxygluconokinase